MAGVSSLFLPCLSQGWKSGPSALADTFLYPLSHLIIGLAATLHPGFLKLSFPLLPFCGPGSFGKAACSERDSLQPFLASQERG